MLKVQCYSGYRVNERPVAFSLMDHSFKVEEIIDRWFGEDAVYFKVRASDQNIYLLKYDENQDGWDLVFYQNPTKINVILSHQGKTNPLPYPVPRGKDSKRSTHLN